MADTHKAQLQLVSDQIDASVVAQMQRTAVPRIFKTSRSRNTAEQGLRASQRGSPGGRPDRCPLANADLGAFGLDEVTPILGY